jgi:FLVCR family feline leukemia virus subgroup C receptor-related protein
MIPGNLVFKSYTYEEDGEQEGKHLTFKVMMIEFLISLLALPCLLVLKTNAPTPPSAFANSDKPIPVFKALKELVKMTNFILLFIPYSVFQGIIKAFSTVLPYIFHPFNYKSSQIAIAGLKFSMFRLV